MITKQEPDLQDGNLDEMRFCPSCGHEGHDIICPSCNEKTESLAAEVDKLAQSEKEDKNKDLTEIDTPVSLEEEAEEEEKNTSS
ncbi:MAG: hypothetical protein NTZ65_01780 [Candidatus Berkelbacteria bacterium]|nr:hypothetical protein [Candidatus Berkelbacteria bacterium]